MKNKKNENAIKGFEEVFDVYLNSDEYVTAAKREQDQNRNFDQYELQHFLELENTRLGLIESFLTKKLPAKKNFSQTEKLIAHQQHRKAELLEKIIPSISKTNSIFQQNIAQIFNSHFI
jgi:hypothetical protein